MAGRLPLQPHLLRNRPGKLSGAKPLLASPWFGQSVIAARKLLYVCGRFRVLALLSRRGRWKRRKAQLGNSRGLSPGSPEDRGTRQRLSALHRGVLRPWSALPGTWQPSAISRRMPVPVQPASVADPFQGRTDTQGLPRTASHVSSPPQAPLPSPRSKASYRNAPSCGIGCLGVYTFKGTDQEHKGSTVRE